MLLSRYAKMRANTNAGKHLGHVINSAAVARGTDDDGESVLFFVLTEAGNLGTEKVINRVECRKMHDIAPEHDTNPEVSIRAWLLENLDAGYLNDTIRQEKEAYLTTWHAAAKRRVDVKFKDPGYNYTVGVKDGITFEQLEDFYLYNTFNRLSTKGTTKQTCIGLKMYPVYTK